MKRREFITLLGGATATWPLSAWAQQSGKVARIGYLGPNRQNPLGDAIYLAFLDEMQKLGFKDGQNLVVEFRPIEQELPALSSAVAEFVRLNVSVILTDGTETALQAAIGASRTVPIVMIATNFDPFERGYIKSLARPSGNVTGLFLRQTELAEKQIELLTQAAPDRSRLAVLWDEVSVGQFNAAAQRAKALRLDVKSLQLANPPYDFEAAFRTLAATSPQMLIVLSSPHFTVSRTQIAELAIRYGLPTMFIFKTYVQAGGLLSYGADLVALHRKAATYAAKILMGTSPADLPVEQPDKYELVVNLKTAKAIGIELPAAILLRADEVIE